MRRSLLFFTLLIYLINIHTVFGQQNKILQLHKTDQAIIIDGIIDPAWQQADSVYDFIQYQPYVHKEPSRRSCARVLTTEQALYCLIVCLDDKKNIQRNTGVLDSFSGDMVSIMLDTFGDKRTAYKFAVYASGVRGDCRLLDDARNRDYSWDGVWFSDAKIYDWGFVVEMEIPYRSIQYDEKLDEWGLDFDRWIPAMNEDIYWCDYAENEGQRISKFGRLVFADYHPRVKGLNLEIYPVGLTKVQFQGDRNYETNPNAGIDIFYNPSQQLTFQLTANPDFAQIEADPYEFNISRYESYFDERRPFFTQGNEIFMPSGREQNSGFYRPLELFYSRRIGKRLPDGSEVPLLGGTKVFGRVRDWEYGGFLAMTGEEEYQSDGAKATEPQAYFTSFRFKKQILNNSSIGILYVGKNNNDYANGVIDVDGAFRQSDWQLSYQIARSYRDDKGDYAGSFGLLMPKEKWILATRGRYIGKNFDINQVGYVPWLGTGELTLLAGPRWFFKEGYIHSILIYFGFISLYEHTDRYTDRVGAIGLNMQFRNNWGYEISFQAGKAKDLAVDYTLYEIDYSSWFHVSPKWEVNLNGLVAKTYNFQRNYLAYYTSFESQCEWRPMDILSIGTSFSFFIEGNPNNEIAEVTYNSRPFMSVTPINDLNVRIYLDNLYLRSSKRVEQIIGGLLFSYNFRPKSWIYLAINEVQNRAEEYDATSGLLPNRLHVADRVSVIKLKYLFYF